MMRLAPPRRRPSRASPSLPRAAIALGASLHVACVEERVIPLPRQDARAQDAADGEGSEDGAVASDAGEPIVETDAGFSPDGGRCRPNDDGVIDRAEVQYALGGQVLFVSNEDGTVVDGVRTAPVMTPTGPQWDFSAMRAEDRRVLDEVVAPSGRWWQALYPAADFALPIDRASTLFALYRATPEALSILATVSREAGRSNVAYVPAVDALRFPLRVGSSWSATSAGNGLLQGVATSTVNTWRFAVDQRGTVLTPATRFSALRLRMELDQTVTGTVLRRTQRTYLFIAECWGLVARVASVDNEPAAEFTRASEYRRLGL
jgi:hypothetical protein